MGQMNRRKFSRGGKPPRVAQLRGSHHQPIPDQPRPPLWSRLFQFERKLGWPEVIASAALVASIYAVVQSREANSPRVDIAAVPARSYLVCHKESGEFRARNVVLFRLSNNGGRTTTFVGLSPLDGAPTVSLVAGGQLLSKPWHTLQVLDKLEDEPNGFDSPSWEIEPVFASAKNLVLREKEGGALRARPTVFDIALEPGKSKIVAIGVTLRQSESSGQVERLNLVLLGSFSHGESALMQASVELPALGQGPCSR